MVLSAESAEEEENRDMVKMIAYCGLICSDCPTYLATQSDDDEARAKTAELYSKKFGFRILPKDINCAGCLSDGGRLIGYCNACHIRKCCREKNLANCSVCNRRPCDHLNRFHASSPEAKENISELMKQQYDVKGL